MSDGNRAGTGAHRSHGPVPRPAGFVPDWVEGGGRGSFLPSWAKGGASSSAGGGSGPSLLFKGGSLVLPDQGIIEADLLTRGDTIEALGRNLPTEGAKLIDTRGKLLIPGVVDPHVHLGIFGGFREELASETRSAALNGVTTLGLFYGSMEPYLKTLEATIGEVDRLASADLFLNLAIFTREQVEEIPIYASRFGITSFKLYLCGVPGIFPGADDAFALDVMEAVAKLGEGALLCVHAENEALADRASAAAMLQRPKGLDPASWASSRPSYIEEEAIRRAAFLGKTAGVKLYFVHVSSSEGLQAIRELKHEGREIRAETTSPYLTLEPGSSDDSRTLMVPPLRGGEDRLALWRGLKEGLLDSIGTDHTPLDSSQKRLGSLYPEAGFGYPAVGTHLPSLVDSALRNGFPLDALVRKMCQAPAEIFGIYPRKGSLLPGSDADIVMLDLQKRELVTPERAGSRSDFALHEGEMLRGWPCLVVKGGIPLDSSSAPRGRYLRRRLDNR